MVDGYTTPSEHKVVHKEVYIDALKATEMPFHLTGFRYDCVSAL